MLQNTTSWFSSWWRNSKVLFGKTTELVWTFQMIAWGKTSWIVSLVWKTWKWFSLVIAMIACITYRLIVLITYKIIVLACLHVLHCRRSSLHIILVHYVFTVMTTIAYSPRKKWSGWNLTNLTGGYGPEFNANIIMFPNFYLTFEP